MSSGPATSDRRRRAKRLLWTGLVMVFAGVLPLLSVIVSSAIARAAGCELNESGANPCVILGIDWGGTLVTMFVAGWLMLVSIPVAAVGLVPLGLGLAGLIAAPR